MSRPSNPVLPSPEPESEQDLLDTDAYEPLAPATDDTDRASLVDLDEASLSRPHLEVPEPPRSAGAVWGLAMVASVVLLGLVGLLGSTVIELP